MGNFWEDAEDEWNRAKDNVQQVNTDWTNTLRDINTDFTKVGKDANAVVNTAGRFAGDFAKGKGEKAFRDLGQRALDQVNLDMGGEEDAPELEKAPSQPTTDTTEEIKARAQKYTNSRKGRASTILTSGNTTSSGSARRTLLS